MAATSRHRRCRSGGRRRSTVCGESRSRCAPSTRRKRTRPSSCPSARTIVVTPAPAIATASAARSSRSATSTSSSGTSSLTTTSMEASSNAAKAASRRLWTIFVGPRFYAEEEYVREMKDEEMVRMLLHDGCFIIKHLYNFVQGYNEEELYATRWSPAQLRIDLGMLENQIPFFVLEEIFYHLTPRKLQRKITRDVGDDGMMITPQTFQRKTMMRQRKRHKLLVMAMWYMLKGWFVLPEDESDELYKLIADKEVHHLLHLLHLAHAHLVNVDDDKGAVLGLRRRDGSATNQQQQGHDKDDDDAKAKANIVSAAQLRGLGVKISKAPTKRGGILDVRLRNGLLSPVLEVPALTVDQGTVQLLQNLVAYEQQGTPPPSNDDEHPRDYFTTYAFLMYNLVSSTDDIAVLQEQGVLLNNFGSHETIIEYFKNLCRGNQRSGTEEKTHIGKVLQGLRDCSQNKAYRYWAEAKKYMDSPVKILALIVSTLLAISTVLQTTVAFYPK
ncbi:UPF0481 protein At3g47200 isoform X2 [Oryza sativa Japonica Group]|uniref:UPF0481 protein At3g47200 isoform X2 n=1 Tax=Oryza sativa subsp. japonica TaxID=39947 RepID=UPI00339BDD10